jgi:uncharacterized protein (TIGR00251 family)
MAIEEHADGTVIAVRAVPRAGKSEIDGIVDDVVRVRLAAAPVDGAANAALIELFARRFDIPKSRIEIISGERGRRKRMLLRGVDASKVRAALGLD